MKIPSYCPVRLHSMEMSLESISCNIQDQSPSASWQVSWIGEQIAQNSCIASVPERLRFNYLFKYTHLQQAGVVEPGQIG